MNERDINYYINYVVRRESEPVENMTVLDFVEEHGEPVNSVLELNQLLVECGLEPIKERLQ